MIESQQDVKLSQGPNDNPNSRDGALGSAQEDMSNPLTLGSNRAKQSFPGSIDRSAGGLQ